MVVDLQLGTDIMKSLNYYMNTEEEENKCTILVYN